MLYVVVPVHNRAHVTAGFLDALAAQTVIDFRLVLVDDGCTDDTVTIAREKIDAERLVILRGDGSLWWAGALQRAYEYLTALPTCEADAVLIVNDDVTIGADFLASGLTVLAESPGASIQAVGVDRATGEVDRGAMADLVRLHFRAAGAEEAPNCLSTRGLLMRGDTFAHSGGFRPRWLPHYLSDYEFTLRLRRQGVTLRSDLRFTAEVAFELTGLARASAGGARRFLTEALSNRAKFNPKHWSAFVIMACPPWVVPVHLARIWLRFARSLLEAAWPGAQQATR
jgi:GT2 family glycosyltransferase